MDTDGSICFRTRLLTVAAGNSVADFVVCFRSVAKVKLHSGLTSGSDLIGLQEALAACSCKELELLWSGLLGLCTNMLICCTALCDVSSDTEIAKDNREVEDLVQATVGVAMVTIAITAPADFPASALETVLFLHAVLPNLPVTLDRCKNSIVRLCEHLQQTEVEGREEAAIQALIYLLERSLRPKSTAADVKRAWTLRRSLLQLNFDDESSSSVKKLLLQCFVSSSFLRIEEGRRMLSFIMIIHAGFIKQIHLAIKHRLPSCTSNQADHYGAIYFGAWRRASSADSLPALSSCRQILEDDCIQDFIFHAVHVRRERGRCSLGLALQRILGAFHRHKKHPELDGTLERLYAPVLWRALAAANGFVRSNAATLFFDAFPLINPKGNAEQSDAALQKQFDTVAALLEDPCPAVRVVAAQGICRICSLYWELMPSTVVTDLITSLVKRLAWDISSADVRATVLKGLAYLLDNGQSHRLLCTLLPPLRDLIHDASETVRVAFVDLLLKVKMLKSMKYWSIVPMEAILAQLEVDNPPVCRRIVQLVTNSFLPIDKGAEAFSERCLILASSGITAARRVYHYASNTMATSDAVLLLLWLRRCILCCVRIPGSFCEPEDDVLISQFNSSFIAASGNGSNGSKEKGNAEGQMSPTSVFLDAAAVLWTDIQEQLAKPCNEELETKVHLKFSAMISELWTAANIIEDNVSRQTLVYIASLLPAEYVQALSKECLLDMQSLSHSEPSYYKPCLDALSRWHKLSKVVDPLCAIITNAVNGLEVTNVAASSSSAASVPKKPAAGKRKRQAAVSRTASPDGTTATSDWTTATLALTYMEHLLRSEASRILLLEQNFLQLSGLNGHLAHILDILAAYLVKQNVHEGASGFLTAAFRMHCKLCLLLRDVENNSTASEQVKHLLERVESCILPTLSTQQEQRCNANSSLISKEVSSKWKRTSLNKSYSDDGTDSWEDDYGVADPLKRLTVHVMQKTLDTCATLYLTGSQGCEEILPQVSNFVHALPRSAVVFVHVYPAAMRLLSQAGCHSVDEDHLEVVASLFHKLVNNMMQFCHNADNTAALMQSVATHVKPAISSLLRGQRWQAKAFHGKIVKYAVASAVADVMATAGSLGEAGWSSCPLPPLCKLLIACFASGGRKLISECINELSCVANAVPHNAEKVDCVSSSRKNTTSEPVHCLLAAARLVASLSQEASKGTELDVRTQGIVERLAAEAERAAQHFEEGDNC